MQDSIYRFSLDIHSTQSQVSIPVPQYNTARSIQATLTEAGKPYKLTSECFAVFFAKKADGTEIINYCLIINGSIIRYDFTAQTTAAVGVVECGIKVYGANNKLLTSPRFTLVVHEDVGGSIVPSEDDMNVIDSILLSEANRVAAEEGRVDAENARVEAEQARVEADGARAELLENIRAAIESNGTDIGDQAVILESLASEVDRLGALESMLSVIHIPASEWADDEPTRASVLLPDIGNNMLVLLAPANNETLEAASAAALSVSLASLDIESDTVVVLNGFVKPKVDLTFLCFVVKGNPREGAEPIPPVVTFVGGTGSGSGGGGIYVGSDEPPDGATVWIDPSGEPTGSEEWEFEMDDGSTETKNVVVLD